MHLNGATSPKHTLVEHFRPNSLSLGVTNERRLYGAGYNERDEMAYTRNGAMIKLRLSYTN